MERLNRLLNNVKVLRNNKALTEIYRVSPQSLYTLHRNEYPNEKIQEDYNKLTGEYKYASVMWNGIPFSILLVDLSFIKQFK